MYYSISIKFDNVFPLMVSQKLLTVIKYLLSLFSGIRICTRNHIPKVKVFQLLKLLMIESKQNNAASIKK